VSIGGRLDTSALRRLHFVTLSRDEQEAAIRRLAASGQGVATIAAATGLSIDQVQRVLAQEPA